MGCITSRYWKRHRCSDASAPDDDDDGIGVGPEDSSQGSHTLSPCRGSGGDEGPTVLSFRGANGHSRTSASSVKSKSSKKRKSDKKKDPLERIKSTSYSWSDREVIDPKLFEVEGILDQTVVRLQGSIEGKPFTISNCLNANIFLFDHMNSVIVTDCKDCVLFLGPTKGRYSNLWYQVYDFNAFDGDDIHWELMQDPDPASLVPYSIPYINDITTDPKSSVIPFTYGHKSDPRDSCCLIVIFPDGQEFDRATRVFHVLIDEQFQIIRTKRFVVSKILEEQVFQSEKYSSILFKGSVIAIEISSQHDLCCDLLKELVDTRDIGSDDVIYVSPNSKTAFDQIEHVFNASN